MQQSPDAFLKPYRVRVDRALAGVVRLRYRGASKDLYRMQEYALGFLDERLLRQCTPSGKRLRSTLCLYLAKAYGASDVLDAALALELFHTATLIYDDIQDGDELRRGRPAVWKRWSVADALDAAGALSMMAAERLTRVDSPLSELLVGAFLTTWEGQHLDITLARVKLGALTDRQYLRMIEKKTGALFTAAAQSAGIAAGKSADELAKLRTFGNELGVAYQLGNDHASLWSSQHATGKGLQGDLRQRKRTFPVVWAYAHLRPIEAKKLEKIFSSERALSSAGIREALKMVEAAGARAMSRKNIAAHARIAARAAHALALPSLAREALAAYARSLVPSR